MNAIIENMKTRRSVRAFKNDPVPEALLEQIVEAGTYAASGHDRQPWVIITVTQKEMRDRLSQVNATFLEHPVKDPFYNAPAIIIVLTRTDVPTHIPDGTLAIGNMMLAAHSLGLGSCWINRAREEFQMPEWQEWLASLGIEGAYEGIGHLAVGYPEGPLPQARPRKEQRTYWVK
ncbi:oxygen-insensitive NAD(P)H nitroreductase [gut metagenome]|uniref:Oxygen-insensitive NAD(P)H nitroreductase n=1 Tax=gut metagenome TaxID=749906 RepID=J9C683_9ZZZZ